MWVGGCERDDTEKASALENGMSPMTEIPQERSWTLMNCNSDYLP